MVDRELHPVSQEIFMKIVTLICRILLGLLFVVFGANILHPFLTMPPMPPDAPATHLMNVMGPSGWMTFIGAVQFVGGLLVLIGGTTPLGLVFLGPVLVNILLFHLRLNGGQGIGMGVFATVLEVVLIYAYRGNFAGIFTYKATPTA
jgi:putative oxidoreductase